MASPRTDLPTSPEALQDKAASTLVWIVSCVGLIAFVVGCLMASLAGIAPWESQRVGIGAMLLGLGGKSVSAGRARVVASRARQRECTLLVTDGDWPGATARLDARVRGYEVVGAGAGDPVPGCGRIGRVQLDTRARGRSMRPLRAVGG